MVIAEHFHIVCISQKEEKAKIGAAAGIEGKCKELKSNDDKFFGLSEQLSKKVETLK